MWAQLIRIRLRPGADTSVLAEQLRAAEQPGSGLVREFFLRDQKDPEQAFVLAIFESEEQARAREQDPRRQEAMPGIQGRLAEILAEPPEFTDLIVDEEWIP